MPDSQIYKFFLDSPPSNPFLFTIKLEPQLRPKVGDSISGPLSFQSFRIMRDEIPIDSQFRIRAVTPIFVRIAHNGDVRITDAGDIRIADNVNAPLIFPLDTRITDDGDTRITGRSGNETTHNYFITPANNPQRISSYTTSRFGNDQTLRQLFQ